MGSLPCVGMDDLPALVQRIGAVLAEHPVAFSYLFGSVARGEGGPDSDVDVAIRFTKPLGRGDRFARRLRIGVELERKLAREVDVIDLEDAPLRLAGRILTERIVVSGLASPERVRYETDLFPRYIDFERHARELDRQLLETMAAGDR